MRLTVARCSMQLDCRDIMPKRTDYDYSFMTLPRVGCTDRVRRTLARTNRSPLFDAMRRLRSCDWLSSCCGTIFLSRMFPPCFYMEVPSFLVFYPYGRRKPISAQRCLPPLAGKL